MIKMKTNDINRKKEQKNTKVLRRKSANLERFTVVITFVALLPGAVTGKPNQA